MNGCGVFLLGLASARVRCGDRSSEAGAYSRLEVYLIWLKFCNNSESATRRSISDGSYKFKDLSSSFGGAPVKRRYQF